MNKKLKKQIEEMSTHYWIRKSKDEIITPWEIVRVDDGNIHLINDPEYYNVDVVAIPRNPV